MGLALSLGSAPTPLRVTLPVVAAVLAAGWLIRRDRRRRRRLAELVHETRGILHIAHAHAAVSEPPNDPDECQTLRALLISLRTRESEQLKDLAKKSRNLEALIDALDEPVLATDNTDAVLLCNRSAEVFFGAASGSLVGQSITALFTSEDILTMHAAARAGEVRRLRVRLTTPLGPRVFQVSASPVPAAWGEGIFGAVLILRDVTELDHAAAIKSDFVANASHELRTPVAAIRGAAETLQHCLTDDPKAAPRFANMIVQHAARLEDMLRDLMDLSRLESPDAPITIAPIDLVALQSSLAGQFDDLARRRGLSLQFEFAPTLVGVVSDPGLIMLILRNLIENAVKFAYDQTTIRVIARRSHTPDLVRIEVIDRGIGVPLALQDRVFERYFQVDPVRTVSGSKRGTGLGLSIVKHAAKRLGGHVGMSSVWKEGTTVWAEFPVCSHATSA